MTNSTFEQEKLKDFTVIRNAIFKDYRLTAKAKGVACQLLSLPPTWEYSVKGLATCFGDGESSIRSAISELEKYGYLRREQNREDGRFGKSKYIITDMLKSEKPFVENPMAVNPSAENPSQYNTKEYNTKELNTHSINNNSVSAQKTFRKPTVEDVQAYIDEKGYSVNADRFIDYYTANGWKVGKNPMKDWKAAVRNWERNNGTDNGTGGRKCSSISESIRRSERDPDYYSIGNFPMASDCFGKE